MGFLLHGGSEGLAPAAAAAFLPETLAARRYAVPDFDERAFRAGAAARLRGRLARPPTALLDAALAATEPLGRRTVSPPGV